MSFTIDYLFERAADILNQSLVVVIGIAGLVFFWGIVQYVMAQGDEKKLAEGKRVMIYGIIGLTVMVSIWGIVNLIVFTVFGDTSGSPFDFSIPKIL